MLKLAAGFLLVAAVATWMGPTMKHGWQDVRTAFTQLQYPEYRDMRRTVALTPQKVTMRPPDSLSIPIGGREPMPDPALMMVNRMTMSERYVDPTAPDDSSVARGERMFQRLCTPCHGKSMAGDGPVAAKFMPPPDLLNSASRARTDGYIYTYIRYGGAIMPKYGHALTEAQTWDVIHFVRHRQRTTPR